VVLNVNQCLKIHKFASNYLSGLSGIGTKSKENKPISGKYDGENKGKTRGTSREERKRRRRSTFTNGVKNHK